jgi:general stress protein 26
MNVRRVDAEGNLWFLSASDSHKNKELALDPSVRLYFQGSEHSDFLQLNGRATISTDRAMIKELWATVIQTWFYRRRR